MVSRFSDLNAKEFKVRAGVDWIQLRCRLARNSEGGKLRTRLKERFGVSHAKPLAVGAGNAACVFDLTVQEPKSFEQLLALQVFLDAEYGLVSDPEIVAIEIASDWQHKLHDEEKLNAQTGYLMHSIMPPISINPRMAKGLRDNDFYNLPHSRGIETDKSLYIGNNVDDLLWRVYFKRTNDSYTDANNMKFAKPLDPKDYCARAEVRIKGAALRGLGLVTLTDLGGFKFEGLQKQRLFRFGGYSESNRPLFNNKFASAAMAAHHVNEETPACVLNSYGQKDSRKRPLVISRNVAINEELTESVRSALRSLSNRFGQVASSRSQKSGGNLKREHSGSRMGTPQAEMKSLITICTN